MKIKSLNKQTILKFICQTLVMIVAGIIGGSAFKTFFESVGIIPTGVSGLSLIIHNLFARGDINIPTSVIYLTINSAIILTALKVFGLRFLLLSGIGIGSYTLAMQFGDLNSLINKTSESTSDLLLLYSIVGGMIMGLMIGLALRYGGSTGGSDIAGALLNKFFPKIKTGYFLLGINAIVITLSVVTTGSFVIGLYALVSTIISSMATNLVLDDSKRVVAFYIICNKPEAIAEAILDKFHRGVTKLDVQGMFSQKEKTMLLSLVPKGQAHEMKKLVNELDRNAFVFSSTVTETLGDGNFMKEASIFKNKVSEAKETLKSDKLLSRKIKAKKTLKKKYKLK